MVTIVYVSLNNPNQLFNSIDSILKFNLGYEYEFIVVAYLYSPENYSKLTNRYKDLKLEIIKNDVITGFSENNNLALNKIKTKYTLILNDDTYVTDNSIDKLVECGEKNNHLLLSPEIRFPDGTIQFQGRHRYNLVGFIFHELKLSKFLSKGKNNQVLFETFNVSGACFLISTQLFKSMGFFNEYYFFTPEDIEISIESTKRKVYPMVYRSATIFHLGGATATEIFQATLPSGYQGAYHYFRRNYGLFQEFTFRIFILTMALLKYIYWIFRWSNKKSNIMRRSWLNTIYYAFSFKTPKEIFFSEYSKIIKANSR